MGFLIAAFVLFGFYQGLVEYRTRDTFVGNAGNWDEVRGYEVWRAVYEAQQAGYLDHFHRFIIAGLVIGLIVTLISPFLVFILASSRPIWWMFVCCSGGAIVGVIGGSVWQQTTEIIWESWGFEFGPGYYCSLAFPILNFIGLLCIRKRSDEPNLDCAPVGTE